MLKAKDNKAAKDKKPSEEPVKKPLATPSIIKGNSHPIKREDF